MERFEIETGKIKVKGQWGRRVKQHISAVHWPL
jgi:hypothetical protein